MAEQKGRKPTGENQQELWQAVPLSHQQTRRRANTRLAQPTPLTTKNIAQQDLWSQAPATPQPVASTADVPPPRTEEAAGLQAQFVTAHAQALGEQDGMALAPIIPPSVEEVDIASFVTVVPFERMTREEIDAFHLPTQLYIVVSRTYERYLCSFGRVLERNPYTGMPVKDEVWGHEAANEQEARNRLAQEVKQRGLTPAELVPPPLQPVPPGVDQSPRKPSAPVDPEVTLPSDISPYVTFIPLYLFTPEHRAHGVDVPTPYYLLASDRNGKRNFSPGHVLLDVISHQNELSHFNVAGGDISYAVTRLREAIAERRRHSKDIAPPLPKAEAPIRPSQPESDTPITIRDYVTMLDTTELNTLSEAEREAVSIPTQLFLYRYPVNDTQNPYRYTLHLAQERDSQTGQPIDPEQLSSNRVDLEQTYAFLEQFIFSDRKMTFTDLVPPLGTPGIVPLSDRLLRHAGIIPETGEETGQRRVDVRTREERERPLFDLSPYVTVVDRDAMLQEYIIPTALCILSGQDRQLSERTAYSAVVVTGRDPESGRQTKLDFIGWLANSEELARSYVQRAIRERGIQPADLDPQTVVETGALAPSHPEIPSDLQADAMYLPLHAMTVEQIGDLRFTHPFFIATHDFNKEYQNTQRVFVPGVVLGVTAEGQRIIHTFHRYASTDFSLAITALREVIPRYKEHWPEEGKAIDPTDRRFRTEPFAEADESYRVFIATSNVAGWLDGSILANVHAQIEKPAKVKKEKPLTQAAHGLTQTELVPEETVWTIDTVMQRREQQCLTSIK